MPDITTVDGVGSLGGRYRTCKKSHRKYKGKGKNRRFAGCRKGGWVRHRKAPKRSYTRAKSRSRSKARGRTLHFNPSKVCAHGQVIMGGQRRGRCPTKAESLRRARRLFRKATGVSAPRGASLTQMSILAQQAGVNLERAAEMEMKARQAGFAQARAANIGPIPVGPSSSAPSGSAAEWREFNRREYQRAQARARAQAAQAAMAGLRGWR